MTINQLSVFSGSGDIEQQSGKNRKKPTINQQFAVHLCWYLPEGAQ